MFLWFPGCTAFSGESRPIVPIMERVVTLMDIYTSYTAVSVSSYFVPLLEYIKFISNEIIRQAVPWTFPQSVS